MHERLPLPDRETVSKARLETARSAVERGVGNHPTAEYEEFARELLQNHDAQDLVSSLLRDRFRDMLLESSIPDISTPAPTTDRPKKGKNRGEGKSSKKSGSRDGFKASRKSANRKRKYSGSGSGGEKGDGSSGRRGKLKKSGAGRR